MKKSFRFSVFALFACLSMVAGACVSQGPTEESEREDLGEAAEALDSEGEGEIPAQQQDTCATDCDCQLGTFCYRDPLSGFLSCRGTAIFGPALPIPVCVASCQCGPGGVCDMSVGPYGYCQ